MTARSVAIASAFLLIFACAKASAQQTRMQQTPTQRANSQQTSEQAAEAAAFQAAQARVSRIMETSVEGTGRRAELFNNRLSEINAARPLDIHNLDTATASKNAEEVVRFLSFLDSYTRSNDSATRVVQDSLFAVRQDLPKNIPETSLDDFEDSFVADAKAFDTYLDALSKTYSRVLDVLLFMQHTPHTLGKSTFVFRSKAESSKYQKLMKSVDLASREVKKAGEASQKASEHANLQLQQMNQ